MIDINEYKWYLIGFLVIYVGLNYLRLTYNKKNEMKNEGFQNILSNLGNNAGYGGKSVNPISNQTVQFDTNYYLRDNKEGVLVRKTLNVIPMKCNTYYQPTVEYDKNNKEVLISTPITYLDKVVEYLKRKVYPLNTLETDSSVETIHKLVDGYLDVGFINEEILLRYYNRNCKYLNTYLNNYYLKNSDNKDENTDKDTTKKSKDNNYKYKKLNFGVISTAFYQDMYLFVPINSKINYFWDFSKYKNQVIGVYRDSYYYFKKLVRAYIIDKTFKSEDDLKIKVYDKVEVMVDDFNKEDINGFYIVSHPKNEVLLNLTKDTEVRLIHLQKRLQDKSNKEEDEDKYNELSNQNDNELIVNNNEDDDEDDEMTQEERLNALTNAAIIEPNMKDNFNIIINKVFQSIVPRSINLNSFYKTANPSSYIETYSLKMVLVMRNDVVEKYGNMFVNNYFCNLENIKNDINMNYFKIDVDNYNIIDFDYKDTISFYKHNLPIHKLAKQYYIEKGFIKKVINRKSKWL